MQESNALNIIIKWTYERWKLCNIKQCIKHPGLLDNKKTENEKKLVQLKSLKIVKGKGLIKLCFSPAISVVNVHFTAKVHL